jgi:hypothetical protein
MKLAGHWVSSPHVTFTNPLGAGSSFFLDIVIGPDGVFQGIWDEYTCMSYPGAYGINIISCSRVQRPARVHGTLDLTNGTGEIDLDQLGRSSFKYSVGIELILHLPKQWLNQGDPVLYTTKLTRAAK